MKKYLILISLALAGLTACNPDGQPDTSLDSEPDRQFLLVAYDEALYQINSGQVAASNASREAVQKYGEDMTREHTTVTQALQKLATGKQITIPTTLSDDRQQQLDSLAMRSGAAFDSLYLQQMVNSHNRAIHSLEVESTSGSDADVKAWASDRLPIARQLVERAKALRDSLN